MRPIKSFSSIAVVLGGPSVAQHCLKAGTPTSCRAGSGGGSAGKRRGGGGGSKALKELLPLLLRVAGRKVLVIALLAVARTALSNRLARLQGFLFRAAFLRRVPLFARNLAGGCTAGWGLEREPLHRAGHEPSEHLAGALVS